MAFFFFESVSLAVLIRKRLERRRAVLQSSHFMCYPHHLVFPAANHGHTAQKVSLLSLLFRVLDKREACCRVDSNVRNRNVRLCSVLIPLHISQGCFLVCLFAHPGPLLSAGPQIFQAGCVRLFVCACVARSRQRGGAGRCGSQHVLHTTEAPDCCRADTRST